MKIDFAAINAAALSSLESLLYEWFPHGRIEGHEFKIGGLSGEPGRSLSTPAPASGRISQATLAAPTQSPCSLRSGPAR
jgi:hypothetical protein